jgi:mannose-6-phosphate isomerase-like protein (cupin superfamily)
MEDPMKTRIVVLAIAALGIVIGVNAQQPGSSRGILQISSASVEGRDIVTAMHVYRGAVTEPRHTHPGDVSGFILEGNVTVVREDQPSISLTAGQTFFVPSGVAHNIISAGDARIVATYFVEQGKPLAVGAN